MGTMGFDSIGCDARLAPGGDVMPMCMPYAEPAPISYGGGGSELPSPAVGEAVCGRYNGCVGGENMGREPRS